MRKSIFTRLMTIFDLFPRRILAFCVIDSLVCRGIVPSGGALHGLYRYALKSRQIKIPGNHALYRLFSEHDPNPCALGNPTLLWLWNHLVESEPECIVEMGSGRSTLVLANYAQYQVQNRNQKPVIVSIESEETWLSDIREKLDSLGLNDLVNFMHCRINGTDSSSHGYVIDKENLDYLLGDKKIDILLIDGPSGGHGRRATLPSIASRLETNACVFMDDALRPAEHATLESWLSHYNNEISLKGILPLGNGLAWMQVIDNI